jgi:GNAT superfamily N-acetyltransferase
MELNIRKAVKEDVSKISDLIDKLCKLESDNYDETIEPNYSKTEFGKKFIKERINENEDRFSLVAENENNIVGYFIGSITMPEEYRKQAKIGEGETMFIEEEFRGNGIGSKFIKMFENWCKEKGINRTRLVASSKNTKGVKLYKKLGYEEQDITLEKRL